MDAHVHVSDRNGDGSLRTRLQQDLIAVLDGCDVPLRWAISPDDYWYDVMKNEADGAYRGNEMIHRLCQGSGGRLMGSCMVNPNFLDESLRTMEMCFEHWGFVQFGEVLQYMFDFVLDCDAVERLVRKAVEYDVPVQVHISTSNSRTHPSSFGCEQLLDLFKLVERVPQAKYVLAHAVGGKKDNPPVVAVYLDMVEREYGKWPENFWMEIADFSSPGLRHALARVPGDRLFTGTDWTSRVGPPFLPYGIMFNARSVAEAAFPPRVSEFVRFLQAAGATDEAIEAIGHRNLRALLKVK
jgi:predicted TIM-barrel fold metal-dependent hydrolase